MPRRPCRSTERTRSRPRSGSMSSRVAASGASGSKRTRASSGPSWAALTIGVSPTRSLQWPVRRAASCTWPCRPIHGRCRSRNRRTAMLPMWTSTGAWSIVFPSRSARSMSVRCGGQWNRQSARDNSRVSARRSSSSAMVVHCSSRSAPRWCVVRLRAAHSRDRRSGRRRSAPSPSVGTDWGEWWRSRTPASPRRTRSGGGRRSTGPRPRSGAPRPRGSGRRRCPGSRRRVDSPVQSAARNARSPIGEETREESLGAAGDRGELRHFVREEVASDEQRSGTFAGHDVEESAIASGLTMEVADEEAGRHGRSANGGCGPGRGRAGRRSRGCAFGRGRASAESCGRTGSPFPCVDGPPMLVLPRSRRIP